MKYLVPLILAVAVLVSGCSNKADQEKIQQQDQELAALRAENDQLKQKPDPSAELARLQKDHEELLTLRGEVAQLRDQNTKLSAQLQRALAQSGQAQQQQQQSATELQSLREQTQQMQQAQAQAHLSSCIANLHAIDAAKQTWALENKKLPSSVPSPQDLTPYLPGNTMPTCPDGGTYSINAVSIPPTCSVTGHVLPRGTAK